MSKHYRTPLSERLGLDDPVALKALGWSSPISLLVAFLTLFACWKYGVLVALTLAALAFCGTMLSGWGLAAGVAHLGGVAFARLLWPSGRSTPLPEDFSQEKSLVIRGRLPEALAVLETRFRREPGNAALCLYLADLYAGDAGRPQRAETLFQHARRLPAVSAAHDIYATHRLIDLYTGPLDHPARAVLQARHLVEKHPGSQAARHAEELLRTLPRGFRPR